MPYWRSWWSSSFPLLLIAKFDSLFVDMIIVGFISQIFVYMIRLIRDVDQPFEYSVTGADPRLGC